MGLFDFLTSTRRPDKGAPVLRDDEVRARLLALNRETAPWQIVDGTAAGVDLVAEWRIVDARWYEIFAKAGVKKVFRIELTLDPTRHEVQALDKEFTLEWRAGVPEMTLAVKAFRGQQQSVEFGTAVGFTETLRPGVAYNYRFSTKELKQPIQEAVTASGWTYKGKVL
jgi:hypothetical protein